MQQHIVPRFDRSITNLANIKANWVTFTVFWFMKKYDDTDIHPNYTLYTVLDSSLTHAIQKAHELGLEIALKPMVDVEEPVGLWRGEIKPANWTLWFANYRSFIDHYASLASANDVDLFVVGTELKSSQFQTSEWLHVIDEARTYFSGNMTYAANWDSYDTNSVGFWSTLDYVGVDAYFPLTNSYNPTVAQLISAWSNCTASGWWGTGRNWTNEMYSTYQITGKKIVFTEIGYYSQDGTNTQPWTSFSPSHEIDLQEQANCYQASLEVMQNKTWFMGWFWWNFETNPNAGGSDDNWYTPQNKPAENVLKYYYGSPPDIAVTGVESNRTLVPKGGFLTVNVTLENRGIYPETFNVSVYGNTTIVQAQELTLANGSSATIGFVWNTSDFVTGNYSTSAYAWPLPFETHTEDNTYVDGWVCIVIPGDVNADRKVDIRDLAIIAKLFGINYLDPKYSLNCDINGDGKVDIMDLAIAAKNFRQTDL